MRADFLEVVAVEGQRVGDPKRPGRFIGYARLPAGTTEGASFCIPTKVEGHKVTEEVGFALKTEPTRVSNDRFHRRLLRPGKRGQPAALRLAKPATTKGGSATGKGKGSNSSEGKA